MRRKRLLLVLPPVIVVLVIGAVVGGRHLWATSTIAPRWTLKSATISTPP